MSNQEIVLEFIYYVVNQNKAPFSSVVIGSLPGENSLCIAPAPGSADDVTLAHGGTFTLSCVLNGKHSNQQTVIGTLCHIHDVLNSIVDYPQGMGVSIFSVKTLSSPSYVDREGDGDNTQWLYGSSIEIKYSADPYVAPSNS